MKRPSSKPPKGLTPDDEKVWEIMKRRLQPLAKRKPRVTAATACIDSESGPGQRLSSQQPPATKARHLATRGSQFAAGEQPASIAQISYPQSSRQKAAPSAAPGPGPGIRPAPLPSALDARKSRQLATGRIAIDARIDLHGMTQTEAHAVLRRFIAAAQARGCKFVKVITGKGAAPRLDRAHENPIAGGGHCEPWSQNRGVLRRMVPQWLAQPEMRALVVGFGPAGRGHGGDGALIVELRRVRS